MRAWLHGPARAFGWPVLSLLPGYHPTRFLSRNWKISGAGGKRLSRQQSVYRDSLPPGERLGGDDSSLLQNKVTTNRFWLHGALPW